MHIDYLFLRLVRHFMPSSLVRFFLQNEIIIRPGLETRDPSAAIKQYQEKLAQTGQSCDGKRIMVFGYGGNFAIGCMLIDVGAEHVVLSDKFAPPDNRINAGLLSKYGDYLDQIDGQVMPKGEYITILQGDVRQVASHPGTPKMDLILSRSVYEHLDEVDDITRALAILTKPTGSQIHFIDLRDHYFKYPFEMLTISEKAWNTWFNPTSNLNRLRYTDYQYIFERYFDKVQATILERDPEAFEKARPLIHPEFLTGDPGIDSATQIVIIASQPKKSITF